MAFQVQESSTITFSAANFLCTFSKISCIPLTHNVLSPNFLFLNDCEFNLMVLRNTKTDYDVSLRLRCPINYTIHCKASFIDRCGEEQVAKGEMWHIFRSQSTIVIKRLDIEKEGADLLSGDNLTIRCSLSVDEDWGTIALNKEAILLTDEMSEDLSALVLNGTGTDVKIYVNQTPFMVHKAILRSRSTVFHAMLQHDMMECDGVVEIHDFEQNDFHDYLSHLYTRKIPDISRANAKNLYKIAYRFNAKELKAACLKFMLNDFSVPNFCEYTRIAEQHDELTLLRSAKEFFGKNMKDIIATNDWSVFTKTQPKLATDLLKIGCSKYLFESNN